MKKVLLLSSVVLIAVVLTIGLFSATAGAATTEFAGGSGTEAAPYLIETKEHLNNVRNHLSSHFKMIADIDFTEEDFCENGKFYNNGKGWSPIGNKQNNFKGSFDGNNHSISGLRISIYTTDQWVSYSIQYVGLFGYSTGKIKNLSLVDIDNSVFDHLHEVCVGALVGYSTAQIENIAVSGNLSAQSVSKNVYIGGIAGVSTGEIKSSNFNGSITGITQSTYVRAGGIVAQPQVVTNCYNIGKISANGPTYAFAGGISGNGGTISYCYNNGEINSRYAGGITGYDGNIINCYNNGYISSTEYAGGICGYAYNTINNCYNTGTVTSSNYGGGIAGQLYSGEINTCYNLGKITATNYQGSIAGGNHGTVYASDLIADGGTISNCYYPDSHNCGVGRGKDTSTKDAFNNLKKQSSFKGFDFSQIWTMSGNSHYLFPELKNNEMNLSLSSFEVIKSPNKTQYLEGKDTLNMTGAKGKIVFSNGFEDEITISLDMVEGFNNTVPGSQRLTVKYANFTDTFVIFITEKKLKSIEIINLPSKTSYLENYDSLNVSGGKIKLSYDNDTAVTIDLTEDMVSGFDNSIIGRQQLIVTYSGKTTSFEIEIIRKNIDSISLETPPTKTTYIGVAEKLDTTGGKIKICYNNKTNEFIDITTDMVTGFDNKILGKQTLTIIYQGVTFNYEVIIEENTLDFEGGIGSETNPFIVTTITQLSNIKKYPTSYYVIQNDITFDTESADFPNGWIPFTFNGVLNGNGYSIKNLKMDFSSKWYNPGLFETNNGTIINLTIENSHISVGNMGDEYGGFICAENNGSIINCHSKNCTISLVNVYHYFGGITGNNTGMIQNCTSNNTINWGANGGRVGGIVANNSGTIENCINNTSIINTGSYTPISGGIAAQNSGTIAFSKNLSSVYSKSTYSQRSAYTGGIVGEMTNGKIYQCYNTGELSAEATEYKASTYTGGIVASISSGQIYNCYNIADVYGESNSSSANTYVGGLIGYNNTTGYIQNCYAICQNSGRAYSENLYVGYICGYNSTSTIDNCYYLGVADNGSGFGDYSTMYGNNSDALKKQATYVGFDFENVWEFKEKNLYLYPTLIDNPYFEKDVNESNPQKEAVENAISGTTLTTGVVDGETVIIVPTSVNGAMTESELSAIFNDPSKKITSNNGIIGTGCKVTIGEYVVDLVVKGDIDGDGVATVFDALMVKKALANNGFENKALREFAADVDGVEGTTSSDVTSLLAIIVGKN